MTEFLLWLDVETTGLDPQKDCLLELAMQVTQYDRELTEVGDPLNILFPMPNVRLDAVDPYVLAMHSNNGLWAACRAVKRDPDTDFKIKAWFNGVLAEQLAPNPACLPRRAPKVYPAGRSVHFDVSWMKAKAPVAWQTLSPSHRVFDLTAINLYRNLADGPIEFTLTAESTHRALDDVRADIKYTRALFRPLSRKETS